MALEGGGWVWKLPNLLRCSENIKGAQQNSVSILGKSEHLKEKSTENGDQLTEVWEV